MTGIRKRSPTNKEFKKNFQGLASTRVQKGHLNNQEKKASDSGTEEGVLIRVERAKYNSDGWEVKLGKGKGAKVYMCTNLDNEIPPFNATDKYLVFKGTVKVDVSIDKKSKIYQITNIKTAKKKPMVLYNNTLVLSTDNNETTNIGLASIEVKEQSINLNSSKVTITDDDNNEINLVESQKELDELKTENSDLKDQVSNLEEAQKSLLKRIEIIEEGNNTEG